MCKRAKLKNIKAKSGLNKSILNTSFYQFSQYLEYKAKHNGKFFIKVNPQYLQCMWKYQKKSYV